MLMREKCETYLAYHVIDERLFWYDTSELLELVQGLVVLVHSEQYRRTMKFAQRVLRLDLQGTI